MLIITKRRVPESVMLVVMLVVTLVVALGMAQRVRCQAVEVDANFPHGKLKVTVSEPTVMAPSPGNTHGILAVSRTGVVAAFYESDESGESSYVYRTSSDAGATWGEQLPIPAAVSGGAMYGALREGGVVKMTGQAVPPEKREPGKLGPQRILFSDDFLHYEADPAEVDLSTFPSNPSRNTPKASFYPVFDKGKLLELPNGDLLATMYGVLEGDAQYRTMIVISKDKGLHWRYVTTVAYDAEDPHPDFPGDWDGYCEPSVAQLADDRLLCIMRTEGATPPYKPMYTSWSSDMGLTWTDPIPTEPHLQNAWPTLAVLDSDTPDSDTPDNNTPDNGVVACIYGRPGVHVVFSTDGGRHWTDRATLTSHTTTWGKPGTNISCYADLIQVGPNRLLAITAVGPGGTQVFPIAVQRVE